MLDLPEKPEGAAAASHGQRFWGILLVLDSFFVIIFGGALAAKLYQHWTPPPELPAARRHARGKAPEPKPEAAKPAETAENPGPAEAAKPLEPVKAPEPPKAAETAKAPEPARRNGGLPPKPSLVTEAPRRQSPRLQGGAAPAKAAEAKPAPPTAAPASPAGKVKAVAVEFKLKAPSAKKVELAGAFIVRGGKKAMSDQGGGLWTITVYLTPNNYRYHFLVDGKKTLDPAAAKSERGSSVVAVP